METILPYVLGAIMVAVVLTLFAGLVSFAFGSRTDRHLATKLMTARVALQGVAILVFAAMVLLSAQ